MATQSGILNQIVESRRASVARLKAGGRLVDLEEQARRAPPPRDFRAALIGRGVAVIAECKARSPSGGVLQSPYDPARLARRYVAGGAAALSVLTEPEFFGGRLEDLEAVRGEVDIPLLCKDFIVDECQVTGARAMGADAILLIVTILEDPELQELHEFVLAHNLQPLVEVHTPEEVERALAAGAMMIGINNRDLVEMRTDTTTTARLRPLIPRDRVVVSESGIQNRADIDALARLNVDAALIGESLLRAPDLETRLLELTRR